MNQTTENQPERQPSANWTYHPTISIILFDGQIEPFGQVTVKVRISPLRRHTFWELETPEYAVNSGEDTSNQHHFAAIRQILDVVEAQIETDRAYCNRAIEAGMQREGEMILQHPPYYGEKTYNYFVNRSHIYLKDEK